jgi:hypothetical protein
MKTAIICFDHVFGSHECIFTDLGRLDLLVTAAVIHNELMRFDRFFPISCISKLLADPPMQGDAELSLTLNINVLYGRESSIPNPTAIYTYIQNDSPSGLQNPLYM